MRLTGRCYSNVRGRLIKDLWKYKAKFKDEPVPPLKALSERGIDIIDPLAKPPLERWTPPDDPKFWKPPPESEHANYNEEPICTYFHRVRLLEGMKHAAILTKSHIFEGMPDPVAKLINKVEIPDEYSMIQRYIMQSQKWDPTMEKLPKRIDVTKRRWNFQREYGIPRTKSMTILMTNLVRLCQSYVYQIPGALQQRRLIFKPFVQANFDRHGIPVQIKGTNEMLTTGSSPLPPFADEDLIDESVQEKLLDMYPVLPTIDLEKHHIYTHGNDTGFRKDFTFKYPHTLFMINGNYWKNEERQGQALMYCFAYALTQAEHRFGVNIKRLPEPISVQCVNADETTYNFTFFQLNTLNLDDDSGIKNLVWFDTNNRLYLKTLSKPWNAGIINKSSRLSDYNDTAFKKLMAVMLYGIRGVEKL